MRIEFGGVHVRMAEEYLDGSQVRPPLQEMGGEGMAEGVRGNGLADARLQCVAFDEFPHALPREPGAGTVEEDLVLHGREQGAHIAQVVGHAHDGGVMQRHQPLFAALAENFYHAPLEIEIEGLQFDEFGNAHPRRVEEFEHGAIPQAQLARGIRGVEQAEDFILRQHFGQKGREFGRVHEFGGVGGQIAAIHAPRQKITQGGDAARQRAGGVPALTEPRHEKRHILVAQARKRRLQLFQKVPQRVEVLPVGGHGIARQAPFGYESVKPAGRQFRWEKDGRAAALCGVPPVFGLDSLGGVHAPRLHQTMRDRKRLTCSERSDERKAYSLRVHGVQHGRFRRPSGAGPGKTGVFARVVRGGGVSRLSDRTAKRPRAAVVRQSGAQDNLPRPHDSPGFFGYAP